MESDWNAYGIHLIIDDFRLLVDFVRAKWERFIVAELIEKVGALVSNRGDV
jgi:hypothetical protein